MWTDFNNTLLLHIAKIVKLIWNRPYLPYVRLKLLIIGKANIVNVFANNFRCSYLVIVSRHTCIANNIIHLKYFTHLCKIYLINNFFKGKNMAIEKEYDMLFDNPNNERPYMIFPKVYSDNRGSFSEVLVGEDTSWIK